MSSPEGNSILGKSSSDDVWKTMARNGIRMDTIFFVGKTTSGNHHVGASRAIGLVKERECHGGHVFVFVQFSLTNRSIWNTYQHWKPGMGAILYFVRAIINKHYTMCHILNIFKMKSTYLTLATFKHLSNAPRCFTRCAIYTEICVDSCLRMGLFVKKPTPMFSHHFRL